LSRNAPAAKDVDSLRGFTPYTSTTPHAPVNERIYDVELNALFLDSFDRSIEGNDAAMTQLLTGMLIVTLLHECAHVAVCLCRPKERTPKGHVGSRRTTTLLPDGRTCIALCHLFCTG
jgi:hypothetical protein